MPEATDTNLRASMTLANDALATMLTDFRASDDRRRFDVIRDGVKRVQAMLALPDAAEVPEHEHEFEDRCYCGATWEETHASCSEEIHSCSYFNEEQVDSYWMRCDLLGPHTEHENSTTGAKWTTTA